MNGILHDLRFDHLAAAAAGWSPSARPAVRCWSGHGTGQARGDSLLVEATANQVNQFGGYTGMTPAAFSLYIAEIADAMGFPATGFC